MLLIFDFDGTIADTWDWTATELVRSAPDFDFGPIDRADLESLRGVGTSEVFVRLGVPQDRLPGLVDHLRRRAEAAAGTFRLFDGMADLLLDLNRSGDTLALVSSNSEATVDAALGPELAASFAMRSCGGGVFDKAEIFRDLVERAGVDRGRVVAVGDETRDLDAADEAGIASIAVEWGYADAELLRTQARARTAGDVDELRHLIEAMRHFLPATDGGAELVRPRG